MKQIIYPMLVLLLIASVSASIDIVDPKDGASLSRTINDEILVTVKIDGAYQDCTYTHLNTPEIDIKFDCSTVSLKEIDTNVVFFGEHTFEVTGTGQNGLETTDSITFFVSNSQPTVEKATQVNLDTLICVEGQECLWDSDDFLQVILLASIVLLIFVFLREGGGKKR